MALKQTVEQVNKYWTKHIQEYSRKQVKELIDEAIKISKEEMLKGPKNGRRVVHNYFLGGDRKQKYGARYYRRSALGEVIGKEPSWVKSSIRKNETSSYNSIVSSYDSKVQTKKSSSYTITLKDTSPRAEYKSEWILGRKGNVKNVFEGRNSQGYLTNGRSFLGYGLYKAIENWKNKKPFSPHTVKNVLTK